MKLDDIDNALLDLLGQNGRMSNREVGRTLNISEGTVRQRLRKLTEAKAMRLGLVANMEAVDLSATTIVRIKAMTSRVKAIATEIAQFESCTFAALTLGHYDIVAIFIGKTRNEIAEVIEKHIASIPGINEIDAREPVGAAKHRYDLIHIT